MLKWDAQHQDPSKHSKFDALWFGPFKISNVLQNNTFELQHLDGTELYGGTFDGCFLKKNLLLRLLVASVHCKYRVIS